MRYFRVKTGYRAEDFISIDETELERAVVAQGTGKVAVFKSGTVSGNHIISIKEDLHKLLGYNPLYELKPEDMNSLPKKELREHQEFLKQVAEKIVGGLPEPTRPARIHTRGMKSIGELTTRD